MAQSFHIKTFGCQMNMHDSDTISQILLDKGYTQTDSINNANIVLINTCAVREKAEQKAFTFIGRLASLKRQKPNMISGIIGCVAQEQGTTLTKRFPFIDLILGPRNIYRIDDLLTQIKEGRKMISSLDLTLKPTLFTNYNGYLKGKVTSFLKIMEGCDNFCSYCIVPFVRGER